MSRVLPPVTANILTSGCFFVGFFSDIYCPEVIVFKSTSACFKNKTCFRTSDGKLCTEDHKRGMNHENSKTSGKTEMLMVCACCVIFARIMEVDTWLGGKIALFYRLNGSHQSFWNEKRKCLIKVQSGFG